MIAGALVFAGLSALLWGGGFQIQPDNFLSFWKTKPHYAVHVENKIESDISPPVLPEISEYTTQNARVMIPAVQPGEARLTPMASSRYFDYMSMASLLPDFVKWQGVQKPLVLELRNGGFDLSSLMPALEDAGFLKKEKDGWLLKIPVIVWPEATLIIAGKGNSLKMDAESGVFISSFGKIFVVDTDVTGWIASKNRPAVFQDKNMFRPYFVFWGGSKAYIAQSRLSHLGYDFPKAYGVSYTSSAPMLRKVSNVPPPTGWVVESEFEDLYYGFYSYEAEDIPILRNVYKNNIVYGIDPHDRSKRLIIAYNKAYGVHKRHGIIVSREVNDSWIFKNHAYDNKGSGFMIDRNSRRNVVAYNLSERNVADGLVFFESPDNLSYQNTLINNGKNGIRVRNSWDIVSVGDKIAGNAMYGATVYTTSLEDQESRDFKLDPYQKKAGLRMVKGELNGNKVAQIQALSADRLELRDLHLFNAPKNFSGDMEAYATDITRALTGREKSVAVIRQK